MPTNISTINNPFNMTLGAFIFATNGPFGQRGLGRTLQRWRPAMVKKALRSTEALTEVPAEFWHGHFLTWKLDGHKLVTAFLIVQFVFFFSQICIFSMYIHVLNGILYGHFSIANHGCFGSNGDFNNISRGICGAKSATRSLKGLS